jgi:hypothetical protein
MKLIKLSISMSWTATLRCKKKRLLSRKRIRSLIFSIL